MEDQDYQKSDLLAHVYSVAVQPERLEELALFWQQQLQLNDVPGQALELLDDPAFNLHIERASQIAEKLDSDIELTFGFDDQVEKLNTAAFVMTASLRVVASNAAAQRMSIRIDQDLGQLPFTTEDLEALSGTLKLVLAQAGAPAATLRLVSADQARSVLVTVSRITASGDLHAALVTTAEILCSDRLVQRLRTTFELTEAEAEVLRGLAEGKNVQELAVHTQRSTATIRSHLHSVLAKTGTRNQVELLRMTFGLINVWSEAEILPAPTPSEISATRHNSYFDLALPDQRIIQYLSLGDPKGKPFVWLPKNYGLIRWTRDAETHLEQNGLRMIVMIRAGYGEASPIPSGRDPFANAAADLVQLLDHLEVTSCPVVSLGDDVLIGIKLANQMPWRVSRLIACGATFPPNRRIHYQRMPLWPRFIRGNAKYAPKITPFLLRSGFNWVAREGPMAFMRSVLRSSPADLAAMQMPQVIEAMERGVEVVSAPGRSAAVAYAQEAAAFQRDWEPELARCAVPITLFLGRQDPHSPHATVAEYFQTYPHLRWLDFPDDGHLVYLTHWQELVVEIASS